MADLVKKLKNLKDLLDTKKAEKLHAEKQLEEIKKTMKKLGYDTIHDVEIAIEDKQDQMKKLEKEIEKKIEEASNVINGINKQD